MLHHKILLIFLLLVNLQIEPLVSPTRMIVKHGNIPYYWHDFVSRSYKYEIGPSGYVISSTIIGFLLIHVLMIISNISFFLRYFFIWMQETIML